MYVPQVFMCMALMFAELSENIDWKMLTQTRQGKFSIHFVLMKAWEGGDYGDKAFSSNFDWRKHMGLSVGLIIFTIRRQILSVRPIFL